MSDEQARQAKHKKLAEQNLELSRRLMALDLVGVQWAAQNDGSDYAKISIEFRLPMMDFVDAYVEVYRV